MTENIDKAWGAGAGGFCNEAIEAYLAKKASNP